MGKIAFVFSGQGAQHKGMGSDLYKNVSESEKIFAMADQIRPGTSKQCFEAENEELGETINTQPCMFAVEMAAAMALSSKGIKPDMTAGFSLGELAALAYSGAVSFEDGFKMVCKRGELMQAEAEKADTSMLAVIKLKNEDIERLCGEFENVFPVNYNCPGQLSVAGLKSELKEFSARVKEEGGRGLPIKVKGGFHSPFMKDAARKFGEYLKEISFKTPEITLYSDYTGAPYDGDPRQLLSKQIENPVRWQKIILDMIEKGVDTFIEIGPGTTLCSLIKKTNPNVKTLNVEDMESLDLTIAEVSGR